MKNAFFRKYSNLTPILLVRPGDPKRCPKRPQELSCPLNIHLGSHKMCFEPVSTRHVTMGCVSPRARAHIGPPRLESMPGHPLGSANTRAGLWGPATTRGAAPKSGLPRFHQSAVCATARGTCTDQSRAAGGTRRSARSWGTYRPTNTPKSGPGPCLVARFYICETELCQLVKTLL